MKSNTFLIILAIYYGIFGIVGLFSASTVLESFGAKNIDQFHLSTVQYLGQTNIGLALIAILIRNTNHFASKKAYFWGAAFFAFSAEIIGFYQINFMGLPSTTTSWVDTSIRLVIGFASLYFATRKSED